VTVSPFTEALPFFQDLCGPPKRLDIREDLGRAPEDTDGNMYKDAARNLQENVLWRGVREHVVTEVSNGATSFGPSPADHQVW
jgi:hypothetical protein